jgi:hypothetical protein
VYSILNHEKKHPVIPAEAGIQLQGRIPPRVEAIYDSWILASTLVPALFYYSTPCAYPAGMTNDMNSET